MMSTTKKWQKWSKITNHQNRQNHKNSKNRKSDKIRKCKSEKSDKIQNQKKWSKKVTKIDPPLKRPKCHLNGQNRHFVFSEPPGPAFFRFQGVPRDPVLRPKSDPPYFSPFLTFYDVWNWHFMFYHFLHFVVFQLLWSDSFFAFCCFLIILA